MVVGYMSPYPTVVIVTTAHQNASGMLACVKRLAQNLETLGVSGKFKNPENTDQTNDPQYGQRRRLLTALVIREIEAQGDEIGSYSHNIDQENIHRDTHGPPKPPSRLVIIEDAIKARPVPVEEVLVSQRVKEAHPFTRVAQKRGGEAAEGLELRLEAQTGDVDDHPLAALLVRLFQVSSILIHRRYDHSVVVVLLGHHGHLFTPPRVTGHVARDETEYFRSGGKGSLELPPHAQSYANFGLSYHFLIEPFPFLGDSVVQSLGPEQLQAEEPGCPPVAVALGQQHVEHRVDTGVQVLQHGADEVEYLPSLSMAILPQVHAQLQHITRQPAH
ncbi:hypothetical protein EYF80_018059 [Liparis tanakae]|uniref:Uncharacterized protein n=1 Tax=Liparis tanakae TaxID=230148 RepID=A0A4Z2I1B5_9TELE|nr:hypothetical protein EYF80_018059 [Liparis tanakae]